MAIIGKATDEGLHLLKEHLKDGVFTAYVLTCLYGELDFDITDTSKSLEEYLSNWTTQGGFSYIKEINFSYFDPDDVVTFEMTFDKNEEIPVPGKIICGVIVVYSDKNNNNSKSVAIFSHKFRKYDDIKYRFYYKVSLSRESTPITFFDSEFASQPFVDARIDKLWSILHKYGINTETSDIQFVSEEDLYYYFYLENTSFVKLYYDKFDKENTVTVIQGSASLDLDNSKYVIEDAPCIIETPNVLSTGETFKTFQVHADTNIFDYQISYSTDNGATWKSCNPDEKIVEENTFDNLKLRFTFNNQGDFYSYGVVLGSIYSYYIQDIVFFPDPVGSSVVTATISVINLNNLDLTYQLVCNDPNVEIIPLPDGNDNEFQVTFPDYNEDTTVLFTATVSDDNSLKTFSKNIIVSEIPSGNIAVFGGGFSGSYTNVIDYVTISTLGNVQDFGDLYITRSLLSSTSNGSNDRGLFAGGYENHNIIDYITISVPSNSQDFGDLIIGRDMLSATSNNINDRAIFGGGRDGHSYSYYNLIDYVTISTSGDAQDFGDLTSLRGGLSATSNGVNNRAVFGGGRNGGYVNAIDYVNISAFSDAQDFGDLTISRAMLAATSNMTKDRAIFGGGIDYNSYFNTIDYITISTSGDAQDFGHLSSERRLLTATSNGSNDRGLFAGGYNGNIYTNVIEYINISELSDTQDFGDLTQGRDGLASTSNA